MGNRVEELEAQVAELQAAVDGLTEELVEAKERINQLEQSTEVEPEPVERGSPNAEFVPNGSATERADDESAEESESTADTENSAQAAARGADGESAEESESTEDDTDDIIVA